MFILGGLVTKKRLLPQRPTENNVQKKIVNIFNKNIISFLKASCKDSYNHLD